MRSVANYAEHNWFWNIAYFDRPYFESIFEDFVFPDGTEPQYESVLWLQKKFMNWFNRERLRTILTFPVETVNLLDDGVDYVDKEFADFVAEMWAKGHSFFMYRSNSVDSLASCCYSKDTYVLIKDSKGAYRVKFEDIESMKFDSNGYKIFNNGRWCKGKLVKLPNRQMYKVTLTNNKEMIVTDNHRNNVFGGMKLTKDLTTNDYLMVNSMPCFECPEIDKHLTYKDGFEIGEYIGKTDIDSISTDWVLQSINFRKGIIDGWLSQSSHCSTSKELIDGIETICNSLGYITYTCTSNNDNKEKKYHLLVYCDEVLRELSDVILRNNSYYFRIKSIEKVDYDDYVYCFEMDDYKDDTFTLANGIHNYNCRLRNELQDNTFSYTLGAGGVSTGSKSVITINFNRLVQDAYKYKEWKDKEEFYDYLDVKIREQVRLVHKYQIAYDDNLRDFLKAKMLPIYDAGFINMDKQFLTVGINGLVEGAEFLGIDISPNEEYFEYCTRCLKPIYEENKAAKTEHYMFNTEYVPAENLGVKNAKWDKEDGYFSPRDCYNSYFYKPEDETCSLLDKFILHGDKTTKWLDGGSALHANLQEHLSKEQYRHLMNVAIKTGCSYFTFNVPNTICNDCGNISKHRYSECPVCGSENVDYATRVIGYLKRVSKFSEKRQEEEHKRYYWSGDAETTET